MKKFKICILVVFFAPIMQIFGQLSNIDSIVRVGYYKIELKDYKGAIVEFDNVLKLDKTNENAVSGKVNALIILDDVKGASDYVDENMKRYPDLPIFYYTRGLVFNYKKQFKKSIEDFDQAIDLDLNKKLSKIYLSRGIANENLGYYDDAILDFNMFLKTDENNASALYHLGFCNYQLEEYKKAIGYFEKITSNDQKHALAFYNLGMANYRLGNMIDACKSFQSACQLGNINACKMVLTECTKGF